MDRYSIISPPNREDVNESETNVANQFVRTSVMSSFYFVSFLLLHRNYDLLHSVTVSERDQMCRRWPQSVSAPTDCLQYCQSAYQPINSSLVDFGQPAVTAFLFRLYVEPFGSADDLSDLCQRDLIGVCVAVDVEDEGVFIGVMLDNVVVHVHQDPGT